MFLSTNLYRSREFPLARDAEEISGYVLAVAIALWLIWGIWSDGPPVGGDTVAHLIRAEYGIHRFVLNGRLDGWQPSFALGYQQHLFIGPVLTWGIALVQALSFGTLSTLAAFKAVIVLLFASLPLATGYLARSFGLSRQASSVAAILSLLVNSPFGGFGVSGLFDVGLTVNLPGAVVLCIAVGAILRLMSKPSAYRALLAGVLFALLAATHGISLILAAALLPVLFVLIFMDSAIRSLISRSRFRQFLAKLDKYCDKPEEGATPLNLKPALQLSGWIGFSAIVAMAMSAWIVIPILVHYDLRGMLTGWGHTPFWHRLSDVWNGHILFQRGVSFWVAIGLVYGLWRVICGRSLALSLVLAPFAFLGLGEILAFLAPANVISQQIPNRGLGLAGLLAVFPLAAFITTVTRPAGRFKKLLAVAVAAVFVIIAVDKLRPVVRTVTPTPVALAAAAELRRLVPDGARYAMQRDFPDEIRIVGMNHPDFWMAWQSDRYTLNVFNVESSATPTPAYAPDSMTKQPPDKVADSLSSYGVTHVLLVNQEKASMLLASPRFNLVWQSTPMAILAVIPRHGQPNPASLLATECPAQAELIDPDPEHLRISVKATASCSATIAAAWSPKWTGRLDDKPVKIGRTAEGLLALHLPAGTHTIALDFHQDVWDQLGIIITVLACLAVVVYGWRSRKFPEPNSLEQRHPAGASADPGATADERDPITKQLDDANRRIEELLREVKILRKEKRAKRPVNSRKPSR